MSKLLLTAIAICSISTSAFATVTFSVQPGVDVAPAGSTTVITFDSAIPAGFTLSGGAIQNGGNSFGAEPAGDTSNYLTSNASNPATIKSTLGYDSVSFYWGSIDAYNTLSLLGKTGNVIASFTGSQFAAPANGSQTSPTTNAEVTFDSTAPIYGLEFQSSQPAFEVDNIAYGAPVGAVPEPASWAMMIGGLGLVGSQMRRGKKDNALAMLA